MMIQLDNICLSILEILVESKEGMGIAVQDRKLYDKIGFEETISLNFRTGDKINELKELEMIKR